MEEVARIARILGDRATLIHYPISHFDIDTGGAFEQSVSDQLAFLEEHVR